MANRIKGITVEIGGDTPRVYMHERSWQIRVLSILNKCQALVHLSLSYNHPASDSLLIGNVK